MNFIAFLFAGDCVEPKCLSSDLTTFIITLNGDLMPSKMLNARFKCAFGFVVLYQSFKFHTD